MYIYMVCVCNVCVWYVQCDWCVCGVCVCGVCVVCLWCVWYEDEDTGSLQTGLGAMHMHHSLSTLYTQ